MKSLTELREKFDTTVTENTKRENLIQDLKEEIKVNFLANQVNYMCVNHFIIPTDVILQHFNSQEKGRFTFRTLHLIDPIKKIPQCTVCVVTGGGDMRSAMLGLFRCHYDLCKH